jgi:EpsI family protein
MLGVVYASMVYRSRRRQVLFVCASILVPILANGVRAYGIVLLAYLTDNRLAAGVDHIVYGWLFFTAVELALFVVGLRWRQVSSRQEQEEEARAPIDPGVVNRQARTSLRLGFIAILLATVLLGFAPLVAIRLWDRAASNEGSARWSEPPVLASPPWQTVPAYDASWAPDLRGADKQFVQSYISDAHRVDLYCALYSGRPGFELLNSYNRLTNPKLWTVVADNFDYQIIGGKPVRIHKSLIGSGPVSRIVWTWYRVGGEYTGSPVRVKFLQAKARLLGSPTTTLVLAVGADSSLERSEGDRILRDFLSHISFSSQYPQSVRTRGSLSGGVN